MSASNSQRLVQHIRRLAGDPADTSSDGELLRRYLDAGDQRAFAALVRRHGPMVFAVCQSVLRQRDDAEDAYQAVFLILAQKAGSIRRQEGMAAWLQRVAYHVALRARARMTRRQTQEANAPPARSAASACDDLSWSEVRAILHTELAALPEHFRIPLVLCYLEGLTQEEAALRLGWTPGTVKGLLQRGRERLRRRLERRGVALTAALAAALTGQALAETAVRSLRHFTTATATTTAAELAHAFSLTWIPMKAVLLSVVLLSASLVAGAAALRPPKTTEATEPIASAEKPDNQGSLTRAARDADGDPLPNGAVARLGTVRFNHGDGMRTLIFSHDGKTILSRGGEWVCLWDVATGAELVRRTVPQSGFRDDPDVTLRADGKTLLTLDLEREGHVVREWDFATLKEVSKRILTPHLGVISAYRRDALSRDGQLGAVNGLEDLRVFDLKSGRELYKLAKGGKEIVDVVFAGDRLVTTDPKPGINVWEAKEGKLFRRLNNDAPAGSLAASADGRWLAVLEHHIQQPTGPDYDKDAIHVWDLSTGVKKHALAASPKHRFRAAHFFACGKRLLTSSLSPRGKELTVWDVETGERLLEMKSDVRSSPPTIAINSSGDRLAVGDIMGKIELWNLKTGHLLSGDEDRHTWAATVFFLPAGNKLRTLGFDCLTTWDVQTGKRLDSFDVPRSHDWSTPRRTFSPDGRYAVSFTGEGKESQAILWDIADRRRLHTFSFPSKYDFVYIDTAFSPDSSLFAAWHSDKEVFWLPDINNSVVRLWDVRTGKEIRSFKASKTDLPGQLAFSADGKTLLTADKHMVGFDVASGKELFSWHMKPLLDKFGEVMAVNGRPIDPKFRSACRSLVVSPDGLRIAGILDGGFGQEPAPERIVLYDTRTGKILRRWNDSGKPSRDFERLTFSPDGQLLASSDGFAIHLWEVATGKELRTFRGHRGEINSLTFSGDGRHLASTSWDSTVLIWDLTAPPTKKATEECWADLAAEDARLAHRAVWALVRTPEQSILFLKERLHPMKGVSREHVDRLIKKLDDDQFAVREKATLEIQKLGELMVLALRQALQDKPTLEQRRRIEPILADLEKELPSGEALRSLRAVRVLEYAGTAEARELLRNLATGGEGATLTRAAQGALRRLDRSPSKKTP